MIIEKIDIPTCGYLPMKGFLAIDNKKVCGTKSTHMKPQTTDGLRLVQNAYEENHGSTVKLTLQNSGSSQDNNHYGFDLKYECANGNFKILWIQNRKRN